MPKAWNPGETDRSESIHISCPKMEIPGRVRHREGLHERQAVFLQGIGVHGYVHSGLVCTRCFSQHCRQSSLDMPALNSSRSCNAGARQTLVDVRSSGNLTCGHNRCYTRTLHDSHFNWFLPRSSAFIPLVQYSRKGNGCQPFDGEGIDIHQIVAILKQRQSGVEPTVEADTPEPSSSSLSV